MLVVIKVGLLSVLNSFQIQKYQYLQETMHLWLGLQALKQVCWHVYSEDMSGYHVTKDVPDLQNHELHIAAGRGILKHVLTSEKIVLDFSKNGTDILVIVSVLVILTK